MPMGGSLRSGRSVTTMLGAGMNGGSIEMTLIRCSVAFAFPLSERLAGNTTLSPIRTFVGT
jgi:hypothetical protein